MATKEETLLAIKYLIARQNKENERHREEDQKIDELRQRIKLHCPHELERGRSGIAMGYKVCTICGYIEFDEAVAPSPVPHYKE